MPRQPIAIPYALRDALQSGLTHYKIMFLSAPTGWGKTAAVSKLLEKQNAVCLSLRKKPLPSYRLIGKLLLKGAGNPPG